MKKPISNQKKEIFINKNTKKIFKTYPKINKIVYKRLKSVFQEIIKKVINKRIK